MCHRTGKYTVWRDVRASFSPKIFTCWGREGVNYPRKCTRLSLQRCGSCHDVLPRRTFCVHHTIMHQFSVLVIATCLYACVFSCNLPSALLAEWPGSFTRCCRRDGGGRDREITVSRERGLTLLFGDPFHTEPGTGGELSTMNGSDDVRVLNPAWLVDCHTHIINIGWLSHTSVALVDCHTPH